MNPDKLREEFFKEFPLCDCRNNMPPHFADGRSVNAQWVADWWLSKFSERDSLESLIEKCGDDFHSLTVFEKGKYFAEGRQESSDGGINFIETDGYSTPHEAVQNLLTKLKENESN